MEARGMGLQAVKVIALAVADAARAERFYAETLGLAPALENGVRVGFRLGEVILMLKAGWYGAPTAAPNPRVTLQCANARETGTALQAAGVTVSDAVTVADEGFLVGAFLDSEGNKLWFCSPA